MTMVNFMRYILANKKPRVHGLSTFFSTISMMWMHFFTIPVALWAAIGDGIHKSVPSFQKTLNFSPYKMLSWIGV